VVQLEKYFDFSLLSLTSLLSAPEREVTSPSDFKVVGVLDHDHDNPPKCILKENIIKIIGEIFSFNIFPLQVT
jgi:hypothetical protein